MILKEKYLLKKAIETDKKEDYIYAIENIKNTDILADAIYAYIQTKYPLSEILDINNPKMEDALNKAVYRFIPLDFHRFEKNDIKLLVRRRYYNFIDTLERRLVINDESKLLLDVAIASRVYNSNVLSNLYHSNLLHELYEVIKDPDIIRYILVRGVKLSYMNDFRDILTKEVRIRFLDYIIDYILLLEYSDPSGLNMEEYFDFFELDYICEKMLKDNKMNVDYAFFFLRRIYYNKLKSEHEFMLLDKILLSKNPKYIYLLLEECRDEESIKLLEEALKETKNFEYNFYYNLKKNKELMVNAFGGYLALKLFIENNNDFKDKIEAKKMLERISDADMEEIEGKWKEDLLNIMFSDNDVEVKNNGVAKKLNNTN